MNLLLRYSLGVDLWLLVILLVFATTVSSDSIFLDYSIRCSSVLMPIIIRLQARLSTNSSKESLGASIRLRNYWNHHQIFRHVCLKNISIQLPCLIHLYQ
jgi:hypothetical protein